MVDLNVVPHELARRGDGKPGSIVGLTFVRDTNGNWQPPKLPGQARRRTLRKRATRARTNKK